jgi:hypothetical protein
METVVPSWRSLLDSPLAPSDSPPASTSALSRQTSASLRPSDSSTNDETHSEEIHLRKRGYPLELRRAVDQSSAGLPPPPAAKETGEPKEADEYAVRDDSDDEDETDRMAESGNRSPTDWWGRRTMGEEVQAKKRTRWEGGGRKRKPPSQSNTQEGGTASQSQSFPAVRSRFRTTLTPPRTSPLRQKQAAGGASPQCLESQLVVYDADTQPHDNDSDWL